MRRRTVIVALLLYLSAACLCRPALARPAPNRLVENIQTSIQCCNLAEFEKYVSIDALVDNSLDTLMRHLQSASLNSKDLPPALAVMAMAATSSNDSTLRTVLRSELGALIRYGVSSGLLNGQQKTVAEPKGLLAPFLEKLSTGQKILRPAGKLKRDTSMPGTWLVPAEIYDVEGKSRYPFTLHAVAAGSGWQVDRIADMDALLNILEQRSGLKR